MLKAISLPQGILAVFWTGLLVFAFVFAPPADPNTLDLIRYLSIGQWEGLNPLVIGLFNVMGVWPLIYAALILPTAKQYSLPAWPFVAGSFFLGAFALLPYLILRQPTETSDFSEHAISPSRWSSLWLRGGLALAATALVGWGLIQGDWGDFVQQWQQSQFIAVMSCDFLCLTVSLPFLLWQQQQTENVSDQIKP